jgi:hypothetical protein
LGHHPRVSGPLLCPGAGHAGSPSNRALDCLTRSSCSACSADVFFSP